MGSVKIPARATMLLPLFYAQVAGARTMHRVTTSIPCGATILALAFPPNGVVRHQVASTHISSLAWPRLEPLLVHRQHHQVHNKVQ